MSQESQQARKWLNVLRAEYASSNPVFLCGFTLVDKDRLVYLTRDQHVACQSEESNLSGTV